MEQEKQLTSLPENAYRELKPGEEYTPIMPASSSPREVTPYSVTMGIVMAIVFSAAAAFLGLKVGQVFEAAIPIAIIAVGMGNVMVLMGLAQNIWQFMILRALLGLLGGFVPNANALIATQVPRNKSGWALGTLSTGGVSGALLGPMAGGLLADSYGLRPVFFITASVLILCFFVTLFCIRE